MVNNLELIKTLLDFSDPDKFYFVQVLQRKKDHDDRRVNGTNNNNRLIKPYYVNNEEYLDFIFPELKELAHIFGARIQINLNRRSYRKVAMQMLKKVTDVIINEDYDKVYKSYSSVVGKYSNEDKNKSWIIDIDKDDLILDPDIIKHVRSTIDTLQPDHREMGYYSKLKAQVPTKSGFHLITRPFNLQEFRKVFPTIEVHKNNPTNLYIP